MAMSDLEDLLIVVLFSGDELSRIRGNKGKVVKEAPPRRQALLGLCVICNSLVF